MSGERIVPATPAALRAAARALLEGRLVAFPTETVYGLGANADDAAAVARIFAAKRRPADHPVIVHLADVSQLAAWAREVPAGAAALADAFWPGPLTLILPRAARVTDAITGGQDSVGLRVPSHPVARALLREFAALGGRGVAAPSANRFGHVSPTCAQHVADDLGAAVDTILDGGECAVGIESTIVAFVGATPVLLRPGGVAIGDLARVLGAEPAPAPADAPRASGTLASHYAPRTPALRVAATAMRSEVEQLAARDERVAVLARTVAMPAGFDGAWHAAPRDARGYAQGLYAALRALDAANADVIVIEDVPESPEWLAVRDRLARATHGVDDDRD
ncbi:MAG: L-threonylcarbamoyladenylate synthase [Betaproteobacteria bacterium]|nr:L-threonylcarbamoyladenylate synthase [Betaproteobacteria bacterium]